MSSTPTQQGKAPETASPNYAWAAVVIAGLTAAGGFYLTLVDGKFPCPLCFYQRSFALAAFGVMLMGLLVGVNEKFSLATLALPLGFAGLGVALWHVNLERETLECPRGIFGLGSAPTQSVVMFGLLCAALIIDAYQPGRVGNSPAHVLGAVVLGLVLAGVCFYSGGNKQPPFFKVPAETYDEDPVICRPKKKPEA